MTIYDAAPVKKDEFRLLHAYIVSVVLILLTSMQEDLERLVRLMKTIKYGWVGYDGEKHEKMGDKFAEEYRLQLKSDILATKLGVCWDQVEYEAWVLGDTCEFKRIAFVYYGKDKMRNILHASDSNENALIEIDRFFSKDEQKNFSK